MHYQIEAMRHAYVDRNSYLGDPDFVKNPIAHLLDKNYATKIRAAIDPQKAGVSREIKPGVAPHEGSNTTHYSIVDKWGNAVSVTYTLNDWFGAGVMASKTGVILNDEMDDFTSKIGVPNMYGLVQGEANAIAPGKAPLSSMSPTIVTKDGKVVMVVGTPGGSRIITATLLTMLNVIDYGMNIQEAVDAPRFHQQWLPEETNLENLHHQPGHGEDARKLGPQVCRSPGRQPHGSDPGRRAFAGRQAGGQEPLLRRERSTAQYRVVARLLRVVSGKGGGPVFPSPESTRRFQGRKHDHCTADHRRPTCAVHRRV